MPPAIPPTKPKDKVLGIIATLARRVFPQFTAEAEAREMERLHSLAWGNKRERMLYQMSFDKDGRYLHWTGYSMSRNGDVYDMKQLAWKAHASAFTAMADLVATATQGPAGK